MTRREMTRELYDISLKYQKKFKQLLELNVKEYDALKIIYQDWKTEELSESLGFSRTIRSVQFMLKIQPWFYTDKKTGKLISDEMMRFKPFVIA